MSPFELRIFDFIAHPLIVAIYLSLKRSFWLMLIMYAALVVLLHILRRRGRPDRLLRLTAGTVALMTLGELGIAFGVVLSYRSSMYWRLPEPRVIGMVQALMRPDPWWPLLQLVPNLWVVGLAAVWMRQGRPSAMDLGFRRPDLSARAFLAPIAGGWLAIMAMALVWSLVLPGPLSPSATRVFLEDLRAAQLPWVSGILLGRTVLGSVAEEIFFRGVIYSALRQHLNVGVALPVESLLFALSHGQWDSVIPLFAAGCVLTYLYEWKGSLYVPIILHISVQAGNVLYIAMT